MTGTVQLTAVTQKHNYTLYTLRKRCFIFNSSVSVMWDREHTLIDMCSAKHSLTLMDVLKKLHPFEER